MGLFDTVSDYENNAHLQFKATNQPFQDGYEVGSNVAKEGVEDGIYLASAEEGVIIVKDGKILAAYEGKMFNTYGQLINGKPEKTTTVFE